MSNISLLFYKSRLNKTASLFIFSIVDHVALKGLVYLISVNLFRRITRVPLTKAMTLSPLSFLFLRQWREQSFRVRFDSLLYKSCLTKTKKKLVCGINLLIYTYYSVRCADGDMMRLNATFVAYVLFFLLLSVKNTDSEMACTTLQLCTAILSNNCCASKAYAVQS